MKYILTKTDENEKLPKNQNGKLLLDGARKQTV
jgi:hypothetical protein